MDIYYSARQSFGKDYTTIDLDWNGYISWRNLPDLEEVITLDGTLNEDLVAFDEHDENAWKHVVSREGYLTGFYKSLEYVLSKVATSSHFNLLAIAIEPKSDCKNFILEGFEFVGYDLLDDSFGLSSLTNCDGFTLSHTPGDLNQFALLRDFTKAYGVKKSLLEDNPNHGHARTYVHAIWRHVSIGRTV